MAMKGVRGAPGGRGQKSKPEESKGRQQGGGAAPASFPSSVALPQDCSGPMPASWMTVFF